MRWRDRSGWVQGTCGGGGVILSLNHKVWFPHGGLICVKYISSKFCKYVFLNAGATQYSFNAGFSFLGEPL